MGKINPIPTFGLPLTETVGEEETNMLLKSRELLFFADQKIEGARSTLVLKPTLVLTSPPSLTQRKITSNART